MPPSPTTHGVPLPKREGYHCLLAIWEVADSGMGFYHLIDLDFEESEGGERPTTPTGLAASNVSDKQVVLNWTAATGASPIASYRITRNGITTVDIDAPLLTWTDTGVAPETLYHYFVNAIDMLGNVSLPSRAIEVRTLSQDGAPSAPLNLHSMGQTAQSISLMWGASSGLAPVEKYLIFRDGVEVRSVSANQTSVDDIGLTPDTEYSYFVKALDREGKLSLSSNAERVRTRGEGGGYPAWKLNTQYAKDDKVSHIGKHWRCIQAHTSHVESWAPGEGDNVLWAEES